MNLINAQMTMAANETAVVDAPKVVGGVEGCEVVGAPEGGAVDGLPVGTVDGLGVVGASVGISPFNATSIVSKLFVCHFMLSSTILKNVST
jgi:hypothetical protein